MINHPRILIVKEHKMPDLVRDSERSFSFPRGNKETILSAM
jgi:hypothetical protein